MDLVKPEVTMLQNSEFTWNLIKLLKPLLNLLHQKKYNFHPYKTKQIKELQGLGCQIARLAVKDHRDALALKKIKAKVMNLGDYNKYRDWVLPENENHRWSRYL